MNVGFFLRKQPVRNLTCYLTEYTPPTGLFPFFPRANAPKLSFGGSTATPATGITGGFAFGSSAPTSTPSSQAAAPSGFAFGSAGTSTTAQSGTTGGFTFSSGTTTQAGAASLSIGAAAPQAAPTGLSFGAAPAAAATSAATLGAATQSAAPFSLGGQSTGECWPWNGCCSQESCQQGGQLWRFCSLCFCWCATKRVAFIPLLLVT